MMFRKRERYEKISLSERKVAAFARKQAKERLRYPLFADHIAAEQITIEDEAARRERVNSTTEQSLRDFHAGVWRRARSLFQVQPEDVKAKVRAEWRAWTGPRDSTYFAWHIDRASGQQAKRLASIEAASSARKSALPELLKAKPARLF